MINPKKIVAICLLAIFSLTQLPFGWFHNDHHHENSGLSCELIIASPDEVASEEAHFHTNEQNDCFLCKAHFIKDKSVSGSTEIACTSQYSTFAFHYTSVYSSSETALIPSRAPPARS